MGNSSSEHNLSVVEGIYDAFARADTEHVLRVCAKDVVWELFLPSIVPYAGRYVGRTQVREFFSRFSEHAEIQSFEVREKINGGESIVVLGWDRILAKHTQQFFEINWVHVFTLEDGQVKHFREYFDSHPLLNALQNHQ